jgi:hypothetical protein
MALNPDTPGPDTHRLHAINSRLMVFAIPCVPRPCCMIISTKKNRSDGK